jgi:predicted DNA-binding antitoxin AbrB/MazE fold protein
MTKTIEAIYEHGVFKPVEPVPCKEREQVTLTIRTGGHQFEDWEDADFYGHYAAEADESVTLEEVREALARIPGNLSDDIRRERDERF